MLNLGVLILMPIDSEEQPIQLPINILIFPGIVSSLGVISLTRQQEHWM